MMQKSITSQQNIGITSQARILVLMATFNGATWIKDQLASIFNQCDAQVDLLVSDDNSSDETLIRIEESRTLDSKVTFIKSSLPGGSASGNFFRLIRAADVTGYDFVALADQDDVWEIGKLARAAQVLSETGADAYSSTVRAFWEDGRSVLLTQSNRETAGDFLFEGAGQGCSFVFRATLLLELKDLLEKNWNLLQEIHYHDWTIYAMARIMGRRWVFDTWPCIRYRQHSNNDTGARSGTLGIKRRLDLLRTGWYRRQVIAMANMCASAAPENARVAKKYLLLTDAAEKNGFHARTRFCLFLIKNGRRRWTDTLILCWAACCGYV